MRRLLARSRMVVALLLALAGMPGIGAEHREDRTGKAHGWRKGQCKAVIVARQGAEREAQSRGAEIHGRATVDGREVGAGRRFGVVSCSGVPGTNSRGRSTGTCRDPGRGMREGTTTWAF